MLNSDEYQAWYGCKHLGNTLSNAMGGRHHYVLCNATYDSALLYIVQCNVWLASWYTVCCHVWLASLYDHYTSCTTMCGWHLCILCIVTCDWHYSVLCNCVLCTAVCSSHHCVLCTTAVQCVALLSSVCIVHNCVWLASLYGILCTATCDLYMSNMWRAVQRATATTRYCSLCSFQLRI